MAPPGHNRTHIMKHLLAICDFNVQAACAAAGVACARFLAIAAHGHPDERFESALKRCLEMFEQVARSSRKDLIEEFANKKEKQDEH